MTIAEYAELLLLRERVSLLENELPLETEFPEIEFSLEDFKDLEAVITTLHSIRKVYGE